MSSVSASRPCAPYQNTHCRPCAKGYYSDSYGYATKCRLCSLCKPGQFVRTACSSVRDTDCAGKYCPLLAERIGGFEELATNSVFVSDAKALLNRIGGTDEPMVSGVNLFPVYCAVPAVVLVSLIFFVIFKRWKQFPCNRTPPCKMPAAFNPHGPITSSTSTAIVRGQQRHPCLPTGHNKRHSGGTDGVGSNGGKELKPMLRKWKFLVHCLRYLKHSFFVVSGDSPVQCLPNDILEQLERRLDSTDASEPAGWMALAKQLGKSCLISICSPHMLVTSANFIFRVQRTKDQSDSKRLDRCPHIGFQAVSSRMELQFSRNYSTAGGCAGQHWTLGFGRANTTRYRFVFEIE